VRTAGFCSVSFNAYAMVSRLLDGRPSRYPFVEPRAKYDAVMAGVNHLSWLVELRERATGADLLPTLRQRVRDGVSAGQPRCEGLLVETGYLVTSGDHHCQDFLPPSPHSRSIEDSSHGSADDRERRMALLRGIAEGREPWDALVAGESWEKPIDFAAAMAGVGGPWDVHALNLVNEGQVPNLPRGAFVETPARATAGAVAPRTVTLPPTVEPHCQRTAEVTDAIVRAALDRSRALVREAAERDPTITDKSAGVAALDECLAAHADVLPEYA
jgi:alpha-galactosidase